MGVGHVVAVEGSLVARGDGLVYGVGNLVAIRRAVLGQVVEVVAPAVCLGHLVGGNPLAVGTEVDPDLGGTDAVPVVLVVPGLGAGYRRGLGVGVCDGVSRGGRTRDLRAVTCNGVLCHRVGDVLATRLLVEVGESPSPAVGLGEGQGLSGVLAVGVETDSHRPCRGAHPLLVHGNGGLLGCVPVGHVVAVEAGLVAIGDGLVHGIVNLVAIGGIVLGQVVEVVAPTVRLGHPVGGDVVAVGPEVDPDLGGTDAVGVVLVVPGLGTGDADGLGGRVCDGVALLC